MDSWRLMTEPKAPELPQVHIREQKTVDLCGHEHAALRCVRERGHDGQHECPVWQRSELVRWE